MATAVVQQQQQLTRLEIAAVAAVATGCRNSGKFRIGSSRSFRTALTSAAAGRDLAFEFVAGGCRFAFGTVERNGRRAAVMSARIEMRQLVGRFPQSPLFHHDVDEQAYGEKCVGSFY